jgi:hypothetical protein
MTQVSVLSVVPRSSAIPGIETARMVIVNVTVSSPNRVVASTTQGYQPPSSALLVTRWPSSRGHGTEPSSLTPGASTDRSGGRSGVTGRRVTRAVPTAEPARLGWQRRGGWGAPRPAPPQRDRFATER